MRLRSFLFALSAIQAIVAQTLFTDLIVTGVDQGPGACIRMPLYTTNAAAPVTDLASNDMACGYNGTYGVWRVCTVEQGGSLTFQFKEFPDNSRPGVMASGLKGPCSVYMKYVQSAVGDPGAGNGWFKIYEQGYNEDDSEWCTDTLINDNGSLPVVVPTELAGGYYLVRPELMTLKKGDMTPSIYTGCAQIFLDSFETTLPKDVVSIPGYIKADDPSLQFDISAPKLPYTVPGPKLYVSNVSPTIQQPSRPFQGVGQLPPNVVLTNANWFGIELDSYSTAEGCKNATGSCYNQSTTCFSSAGPIGTANCNIWAKKCDTMTSNCNSGNYNGPPDHGKNLNPTPSFVLVPNTHAGTSQPTGSATASASATSTPEPTSSSITSTYAPSSSKAALSSTTALSISGSPEPSSALSTPPSIVSTKASTSVSSALVSSLSTIASTLVSSTSQPALSTSSSVPNSTKSTSIFSTSETALSTIASSIPGSSKSAPVSSTASLIDSAIASASVSSTSVLTPSANGSAPISSTLSSQLSVVNSASISPTLTGTESTVGAASSSSRSAPTVEASNTITSSSLSKNTLTTSSSVASALASITTITTPGTVPSSSDISPTTSTPPAKSTVVEVTTIIWTPSSSSTQPYVNYSPSSTPSSSSAASSPNYNPPPGTIVSPDGKCGPETGYTCLGNQNGPCCSSNGYCGATEDYCGEMYCQPLWGHCDSSTSKVKLIRHRHRHMDRDYWRREA